MTMNVDVALRALARGSPLAKQLESSSSSRYRWLAIFPLDGSDPDVRRLIQNHGRPFPEEEIDFFRVRVIEVDISLIDADIWLSEDDFININDKICLGKSELLEILKQYSISDLELSINTDIPI